MRQKPIEAAAWGLPVGLLGGLIGLGGGEFRIPVLMRWFGLSAREVIPLNAVISLATLSSALIFRSGSLSFAPLAPNVWDIVALAVGGLLAALFAGGLVARLSNETLHKGIVLLLVAIGALLILEGFVTEGFSVPFPQGGVARVMLSLGMGFLIGVVATLLGVAGGELLIPTLVFCHGLDIKVAGTASLMISLIVVTAGLVRYRSVGRLPERGAVTGIALPMALGSIVGAAIGASLAAFAPSSTLKVILGIVLLGAALVSARRSH